MMDETAEQQRARILITVPDILPAEYDLAVTLGYKPESWDGMWKLKEAPVILNNMVLVREVVYGRDGLVKVKGDRIVIRAKLLPIPA